MFKIFKKEKESEVEFVSNKIYKIKFDIVYKNGEIESFCGESNCIPALWTQVNKDILKIYEYKLPCELNKTYLRNISDINYIQNHKMEIIEEGENK